MISCLTFFLLMYLIRWFFIGGPVRWHLRLVYTARSRENIGSSPIGLMKTRLPSLAYRWLRTTWVFSIWTFFYFQSPNSHCRSFMDTRESAVPCYRCAKPDEYLEPASHTETCAVLTLGCAFLCNIHPLNLAPPYFRSGYSTSSDTSSSGITIIIGE